VNQVKSVENHYSTKQSIVGQQGVEDVGGQTTTVKRPPTGAEFLASLNDGRSIWIYGTEVKDVTSHPAFRNTARLLARLYDALHDPAKQSKLITPTDTGSGGFTHWYFKAPRSRDDLIASQQAIVEWARMSYGWLGRSPDYKAAFLGTLGANADFYAPYQENARRWYQVGQEQVLFLNHAFGNPPVARGTLRTDAQDVYLQVKRETDAGIVISGAKTIATGSALTHYNLIATVGGQGPVLRKELAFACLVPMNAPGVKLFCRPSYQMTAAVMGSPFDYPLSSLMDENDAFLVCEEVLVPWENVFIYGDGKKANAFHTESGSLSRFMLHGCTRLAVKLDFIAGLLLKALDMTGSIQYRGVKVRAGEVLAWRNLFWSLSNAMVHNPVQWNNDFVQPNPDAVQAYKVWAPTAYSQIREIIQDLVASSLIYTNSHVSDWQTPEIRPYLEEYMCGADGSDAVARSQLMKLLWDAVGSEFGSRHELFERNYAGVQETLRLSAYEYAQANDQITGMKSFVDQFLGEYDLNGWRSPDLVNPTDVNFFQPKSL
jgi:4-hydroxyphenylacetate 3-monooxygenase